MRRGSSLAARCSFLTTCTMPMSSGSPSCGWPILPSLTITPLVATLKHSKPFPPHSIGSSSNTPRRGVLHQVSVSAWPRSSATTARSPSRSSRWGPRVVGAADSCRSVASSQQMRPAGPGQRVQRSSCRAPPNRRLSSVWSRTAPRRTDTGRSHALYMHVSAHVTTPTGATKPILTAPTKPRPSTSAAPTAPSSSPPLSPIPRR